MGRPRRPKVPSVVNLLRIGRMPAVKGKGGEAMSAIAIHGAKDNPADTGNAGWRVAE
jgi:hypothetical protein